MFSLKLPPLSMPEAAYCSTPAKIKEGIRCKHVVCRGQPFIFGKVALIDPTLTSSAEATGVGGQQVCWKWWAESGIG